jgi:hypothetical protein
MMTRAEKLFSIRTQVSKADSEVEHGDDSACNLVQNDVLRAIVRFLEEEIPEQWIVESERVKEPDPVVRRALDTLREASKLKRR